jgi:hypothetical protein
MMALKHGRGRIAHLETNMMKATKRHAKVPVQHYATWLPLTFPLRLIRSTRVDIFHYNNTL